MPPYDAEGGQVHRGARDTEILAAGSMRQTKHVLRERVLGVLQSHPAGLTDDEGAELLEAWFKAPADRLTFGRRRQELVRDGLVLDSGYRRTTPHGRSAIVWRYKPPAAPIAQGPDEGPAGVPGAAAPAGVPS